MIALYNAQGEPVACADEACRGVFDFSGNLMAWFEGEFLYARNGRYLGWAHQGWVYDRQGHPALFTEAAVGGPPRPAVRGRHRSAASRLAPLPSPLPRRQPRPARRYRVAEWSPVSAASYFAQ